MEKKGTAAFSSLLCQGQSKGGSKEEGMETEKRHFFFFPEENRLVVLTENQQLPGVP